MMSVPAVAIIGGGPAGLMAAEALVETGQCAVHLFDAMPSVGRKFLMAGKSGLNLTYDEPGDRFGTRYSSAQNMLQPMLAAFGPQDVRRWAAGLGIETFVGSSHRVFPVDFKAAPLLRSWLRRLRSSGLVIHARHRWTGWSADGQLTFDTPTGPQNFVADATIVAAGGASWPKLGSDAAWVSLLSARGVEISLLKPANCGFDVGWSEHFRTRFAGQPVKPVSLGTAGAPMERGEFVVTGNGIEGSGIYRLSGPLRDAIIRDGNATLTLDLMPDRSEDRLRSELSRPHGSKSLSEHWRRTCGIEGVKAGLLRECLPRETWADLARLAPAIKALKLTLTAPRPIEEAISSAGGVAFNALDENLMLRNLPGVFCAGEMLDWDAPTGGYLLTACFATGRAAAHGAVDWLSRESSRTAADTRPSSP